MSIYLLLMTGISSFYCQYQGRKSRFQGSQGSLLSSPLTYTNRDQIKSRMNWSFGFFLRGGIRQSVLTSKPFYEFSIDHFSRRQGNDDELNEDDNCPRARVPRPSNRDYVVRPVSTIEYSDKKVSFFFKIKFI